MLPELLCKIMPLGMWEVSLRMDHIVLSELDRSDGFVHFSTQDQLFKTVEKFFEGQEVVVALVDPSKLEGELRFETNPGGSTKYYHLYDGKVPMSSVVSVYKMKSERALED